MQKIKFRFNAEHVDAFNTKGVLSLMVLDLTNRCNLRCLYCFNQRALEASPSQIELEMLERILKSRVAGGVKNWFLSGGEPLCYPRLDEALDMFRAYGHRPKIATNGILLTPAAVDRWAARGVQSVQFSFDTLKPSVFRRVNGGREEDHRTILENLKYAVRSPLRVVASSVWTVHNRDEVSEVMRACHDLGLDSFTLYPMVPPFESGRSLGVPIPEQTGRIESLFEDYAGLGAANLIDLTLPCFELTDVYSRWKDRLTIRIHSCGAGVFNLKVTSQGKVSTCICQDAPDFIVGDLRESDLDAIWESPAVERFRALYHDIPECRDCDRREACRGGCRNEALVSGDRGILSVDAHCRFFRRRKPSA